MAFRLVAEVAQAHDGSLGQAHAFIDAVSKAGVSDIKFQMHFAEHESSLEDKFRSKCFPQDASRYDYWKRMEFNVEQWSGLARHCYDKNLNIIISPFSSYAIDLCSRLNIKSIKIGSGEADNYHLFSRIKVFSKEIILSSGLSTWAEMKNAVDCFHDFAGDLFLLQCTSKYPCPLSEVGINIIPEIKKRYNVIPGLSDHSGSIIPTIIAASQNIAKMSEVHVCFSRDAFGPDTSSSLTLSELAYLQKALNDIEMVLNACVDKDKSAESLMHVKSLFGRSMFAASSLPVGHILSESDIVFRKPGFFLNADHISSFVGETLLVPIDEGAPFSWDHI
jgi:N,N'-diacetyllegionaminate synthase